MIHNPILRGFNPDPSVIRIGTDYYAAVSTFEWWPGVRIYHSRDLAHWRFHSSPLDRVSMLDLAGVPDGGGVWAPDISYDGRRVYLVYTNVRARGAMFQTDNYVVTTDNIDSGVWSEPVYLNSLGFDPSMFHDTDGRSWLLSLDNHYAEGKRFNGLYVQQYDTERCCLTGELRLIYREPHGELVEGSHIYHVGDTYYLLKAQGGTGPRHSAQLSRSRSLFGPYEDCPFILLHSRDNKSLPLTCAGHADIVDTPAGELYMLHLAKRYSSPGKCIFGRESCIQRVERTPDGWLRLADGGENPYVKVKEPKGIEACEFPPEPTCFDFTKCTAIPDCFQSLRVPLDDRASFSERGLCLCGADGLQSLFSQSLLARRVDEANVTVSTTLTFEPDCEKHLAGLIVIYNTSYWYYAYVTRSEGGRKCVSLLGCDGGRLLYPSALVPISECVPVTLTAEINGDTLRFSYCDGGDVRPLGGALDMEMFSSVPGGFTGTMAGICCQDLYRRTKCAYFEKFDYTART